MRGTAGSTSQGREGRAPARQPRARCPRPQEIKCNAASSWQCVVIRTSTIGATGQPDIRPADSGRDGARPSPAHGLTSLAWMTERATLNLCVLCAFDLFALKIPHLAPARPLRTGHTHPRHKPLYFRTHNLIIPHPSASSAKPPRAPRSNLPPYFSPSNDRNENDKTPNLPYSISPSSGSNVQV